MVLCAHCPFVKHVENEITKIQNDYFHLIDLVGISSNSLIPHPKDGPEYLAKQAKDNNWEFPYLFDQTQDFAKALKAACTPDFFLFVAHKNCDHKLRYRGQLDNSRPGNNIPLDATCNDCSLKASAYYQDINTYNGISYIREDINFTNDIHNSISYS